MLQRTKDYYTLNDGILVQKRIPKTVNLCGTRQLERTDSKRFDAMLMADGTMLLFAFPHD